MTLPGGGLVCPKCRERDLTIPWNKTRRAWRCCRCHVNFWPSPAEVDRG